MEHDGIRYVVCWIKNGKVVRCQHRHSTVIEAAKCVSVPGAFIRAISHGKERALSVREARVFQDYLKQQNAKSVFVPKSAQPVARTKVKKAKYRP